MSVKVAILEYMRNQNYGGVEEIAGGTLERYIGLTEGVKPSNVSRRCRELENDGYVMRVEKSVGKKRFVAYKLK